MYRFEITVPVSWALNTTNELHMFAVYLVVGPCVLQLDPLHVLFCQNPPARTLTADFVPLTDFQPRFVSSGVGYYHALALRRLGPLIFQNSCFVC